NVYKTFSLEQGMLQSMLRSDRTIVALDDVNLEVGQSEVLGLVGESGSGKSTLAHVIIRLLSVTRGTIRYRGQDVTRLENRDLFPFRQKVQMVFQDTHSSLNPRKTIGQALQDPLRLSGLTRRDRPTRAVELLEEVGLGQDSMTRYPYQLS